MVWERLGSASVTGSVASTSWKLLDRVTLGSAGADLDTGTFSTKDNIMILAHTLPSGTTACDLTFNADSGTNYAYRQSGNGGSDGTSASNSLIDMRNNSNEEHFHVINVLNNASQEKIGVSHHVGHSGSGAGNAPNRREMSFKWANTSNQINRVKFNKGSFTNFASGSELVILGMDNDEADSGTNFWEELVSVSGTGSSTSLSSGTFAAKKYLKFRLWANNTSAMGFQCNGDTGSNYARRYNYTGGGEGTSTSGTSINVPNNHTNMLTEGYIINNASTEKLVIFNTVDTSTSGSGTAPDSSENVGKWTNTSAQITSMVWSKGGNFDSNAQLTIWGAD